LRARIHDGDLKGARAAAQSLAPFWDSTAKAKPPLLESVLDVATSLDEPSAGRSRETAKRSDMAGWAEYGYCASHSRYFWGLRPHLVCTLQGLPVAFALTGAKADERDVLLGIFTAGPELITARPGQTLIGDKNYFGASFEAAIADAGITLLRPARKGEPARPGARLLKPLRQIIESVNDTFQRPARPRTARRPHPRRRDSPRPAAHPRTYRRHLAQRRHRAAHPPVARGL
jgi:hypothetical protein